MDILCINEYSPVYLDILLYTWLLSFDLDIPLYLCIFSFIPGYTPNIPGYSPLYLDIILFTWIFTCIPGYSPLYLDILLYPGHSPMYLETLLYTWIFTFIPGYSPINIFVKKVYVDILLKTSLNRKYTWIFSYKRRWIESIPGYSPINIFE